MEFASASTSKKGRPGTVAPVNVPHYDEIECDANGLAIIPVNFLPGLVGNLPIDWYYVTYPYYKYFDRDQRDATGGVSAPANLLLAKPENVTKWKSFAERLFGGTFKESGRYHYGMEMGRMVLADGYRCFGKNDGRSADTTDITQHVLFNEVAPALLNQGSIGKLISYVWKWLHVPTLETNNKWVKDSLIAFFKVQDCRVVLSERMTDGMRVHSIVKLFKKYGTQSAIRGFKNRQQKEWGFTIEINKHRDKDGALPRCVEGESWSSHNIEGHLEKKNS